MKTINQVIRLVNILKHGDYQMKQLELWFRHIEDSSNLIHDHGKWSTPATPARFIFSWKMYD